MKTQEELNALKEEVVTLNEKLHELTEEELAQVSGGWKIDGSWCTVDCLGRCNSSDCPYSYCNFNRW